MVIKDEHGFEYFEWPSLHWKRARSILDFTEIHPDYEDYYKVKIGLKYIIYSKLRDVYELYEITEHTREEHLIEYIKQQRIYLLS